LAERSGYSRAQIALHWLLAVLIPLNWFLGEGAEEARRAMASGGEPVFALHIPVGLLILILVIARIVLRLRRGAPEPPGTPGSLQVTAAVWGHRLIYLLMLGVPLGGAAIVFLNADTGAIHGLFANVLMIVVLGHAVMALYHHYVVKDGLLRRMMRAE
jgi:cytochrome b561